MWGGHGASGGSVNPAFVVLVVGAWLLLAIDRHGFVSFGGRLPWSTLSRGRKFWLVFGFFIIPEIMVAVYLLLALRDHLRAQNMTLLQQIGAGWEWLRDKSQETQAVVASGAVVALMVVTLLSMASFAHG